MARKVIIVGRHPIATDLLRQYKGHGCDVEYSEEFTSVGNHINGYEEACLLTGADTVCAMEADNKILDVVQQLAQAYKPEDHGGRRLVCHVLLQSQTTLWLLQTMDLLADVNASVELYPFTMADQWAKNVLCHLPWMQDGMDYTPLDWQPIGVDSMRTVHLLVVGTSEMAESLALHAAMTAHFPNYVRDKTLRTRITMLYAAERGGHSSQGMEGQAWKDAFIQRYRHLFDNSYFRCITLGREPRMTDFHPPMYAGSRLDFVDVEWEFVEGGLHDPVMQEKLRRWARMQEKLLTIALCTDVDEWNQTEALTLPEEVYQRGIPVLTYVRRGSLLERVCHNSGYTNILPFGMENRGYDISIPLMQMAKRLNYFYNCSFGDEGLPTHIPVDRMEADWRKLASFNLRYSNINNVLTIATKMRSLGHDVNDWQRFYALTQEETEQLAAVEHNRWCVERLIMGFRPPRNDEREEIRANIREIISARQAGNTHLPRDLKNEYKSRKIHFDLVATRELSEDKTGKNVRVYDYDLTACIPLIANSINETER